MREIPSLLQATYFIFYAAWKAVMKMQQALPTCYHSVWMEYCVVEAFQKGKPRPWWCFSLGYISGSSLRNALPHVLNHLSSPRKICCPEVADSGRCSDPGKTVYTATSIVHEHQSFPSQFMYYDHFTQLLLNMLQKK